MSRTKLADGFVKFEYFYPDTKILKSVRIMKNGKLHNFEDKPAKSEYYPDGKLKLESFYLNGNEGREDEGPTIIGYHNSGTKSSERFYDGANSIEIAYYPSGIRIEIFYYKITGKVRHEHCPNPETASSTSYYEDGAICNETFRYEGHDRRMLPYSIKYYSTEDGNGIEERCIITDDNFIRETFYSNGNLKKKKIISTTNFYSKSASATEPSIIEFYEDGSKKREKFYANYTNNAQDTYKYYEVLYDGLKDTHNWYDEEKKLTKTESHNDITSLCKVCRD